MESIASRLKNFIEHKELSTSAFSRKLGYKSCEKIARLFRIKNEGAKPSVDIVADITQHFSELNMRWLLIGEGEMLHSPAASHSIISPVNVLRTEALESLLLQSRMEEPDINYRVSITQNA
ncbi:hypothetical protein [Chitinophaga deserti]|uniref:hypothetical protein n=1 Tax=Chitinophaga deserti TaxID=2164099 RepID=UPI000D6C6FE7|nr:hypothetical protein [Chitinophaga deserti]